MKGSLVEERIKRVDAEMEAYRLHLAALELQRAVLVLMRNYDVAGSMIVFKKQQERSVVEEAEKIIKQSEP
jgi:hypothetical protein